MELWLAGVVNVFSLYPLIAITVGVAIGIVFGAIPGMSATMAVALCLPMTFGMSPVVSMALLIGLYVGGISGGLISAVLLNIPGTPSSIATTFDGHPMAARGEAGRALGIGILYSFIGTLMGCLVLFFLAPPISAFALRFGSFEFFSISVFALTLVAGLAGNNLPKGLISAVLGLLIGMIGIAPIDAYKRFTFGQAELDAGLALLPVLLGLFAMSEVFKAAQESYKSGTVKPISFRIPGFFGMNWKEFKSQSGNMLRSGLVGVSIGILPGIGSGTSNMLAYLTAKNSSKHPEKFGTGVPDGIVASETSNNAGIGAEMIPLMTLGIPGDAVTAMLLGAFLIHGIQPGPMLFTTNGDLVYSIFVSLLVASFVMLCFEYFGIRVFVRLLAIPKHYLLAIVMVMCVIGAYATNNRMFDVYTLFAFGALGYVMVKFRYPFPPLILGFVLGPMIERNLRSALMSSQGDLMPFIQRPFSAIFLLLAVAYVTWVVWGMVRGRKPAAGDDVALQD